ncbi:unnamed protein product [Durusdinium trenchii]|uniref:Uncharacterized protein n=2 Tax=Durusdinium trenchii TaxID=1381693 RepID=A0ABP0LMW8_9DINO
MKGPSLAEVTGAKLREALRLVRLKRSYDAETVAGDAKALFERLDDKSGMTSASYFLVEAALLEERISDARRLVEEGQALAKGTKVDEARMLRASMLVKLAEGKPLDALQIAATAERLLLEVGTNHREAGELLLLVAKAHVSQGTTAAQQAALNAALQAVDQFSKAEDAREADAWRLVLEARVALRRFDDGLRAAEAAMVICLEYGDETGQALCLLSLAKAHKIRGLPLKTKKASEKALSLFQEQSSDVLAAEALHLLVEALIGQEQRKEALQRAKQELYSFLSSGDKWAVPSMRLCLVTALLGMDRKKDALSETERALQDAEELTKNVKVSMMKAQVMKQLAICNMLTGSVDKAKALADQILPMCRELGDIEGEDSMNELIGLVVQQRGALEEHAAKEREAEELILQLKEAMLARDGPTFKAVLEKCYENENVFTENVEEIISPVIATDPDGLYQFFLDNQPEKWKVNPDEDQKFDSAQQFDRRLMYYAFRLGAMGYGPGFRLIKTAYRLGQNLENTQGYGTLNLMDNCPPWEERSQFHPGVLDCVLQVGAVRGTPNEYQYSSVIK